MCMHAASCIWHQTEQRHPLQSLATARLQGERRDCDDAVAALPRRLPAFTQPRGPLVPEHSFEANAVWWRALSGSMEGTLPLCLYQHPQCSKNASAVAVLCLAEGHNPATPAADKTRNPVRGIQLWRMPHVVNCVCAWEVLWPNVVLAEGECVAMLLAQLTNGAEILGHCCFYLRQLLQRLNAAASGVQLADSPWGIAWLVCCITDIYFYVYMCCVIFYVYTGMC